MPRKNSEASNSPTKASKPRVSASKATSKTDPNLPTVSKQTAGGIVGAAIGGMIAGPVGAVAGGVAGAMVGNASAQGQHPIETAVNNVASVTKKPLAIAVKRVKAAVGSTKTRTAPNRQKDSPKSKSTASASAQSGKARGPKSATSKGKARSK